MKRKPYGISSKTKEEGPTPISDLCWSPKLAVGEQYICFHSNKGLSDMDLKVSPQGVTLVPTMIGLMADTKADSENNSTTKEKKLKIDTTSSATEEIKSTSDPQENHTVANFNGPMHVDSEITKNLVMEEAVHVEEHKKRQVLSNHFSFLFFSFN